MQEPMSIETLGAVGAPAQSMPVEQKMQEIKPQADPSMPESGPQALSLPPAGKPSSQDIQTALKNAGFYSGNVDGKIGPMTKKAIIEFQKANGLQPDGKVGPKTWEILSKSLAAPVASAPVKKGRKR